MFLPSVMNYESSILHYGNFSNLKRMGIRMFEAFDKKARTEQELYDVLRASLSINGTLISPTQLLRRAAAKCPTTAAIIFQDQSITYQELFQRACALTQLLRNTVQPRDRVIICFENSPEFYIAYWAAWQLGAVVIPLNIFLREREINHIVNDSLPAAIITSSDRVGLFERAGIDSLPAIFTEQQMQENASDELGEAEIFNFSPDEMAVLLYTSGTTGEPKGVMLSGKNIITNVLQSVTRIQLTQTERVFAVLPLFHAFAQCACIWAPVLACCTVVLVPKIDRRQIMQGLAKEPTVFLGVPALYGLMCLLKNAPLDSIKFFASGGDAMPDRIRMAFELLYRRKICSGFGMTETSPVISWDLGDDLESTDAAGRPLIGVDISIRDVQGKEMSCGTIGAIWVRGDNVMLGYYNAPERTAEVIKDGWLDTGDLGYVNANGRIVITGRLKDLIKNKGFNIYPQEVENILALHPNVLRVAVVGKPDESEGEIPVAYVQLRATEPYVEKALEALCKAQLAFYKVPRVFHCSVDELPSTAMGKVNKKELRTWQK
jgi:long-chain acyl-CoA synthetase